MEKQEVISILRNAEPIFSRMYNILAQCESVETQLNIKKDERQSGLGLGHWIAAFFLCCIYIFPGIIYYNVVKKNRNNRLDEEILSLEKSLEKYEAEFRNLVNDAKKTGIFNILPAEYLDPDDRAVSYILSYLQSGRADSLKEAMNLFEEEKHRLNMERMQNQALEQSRLNSRLLKYNNIINAIDTINNLNR